MEGKGIEVRERDGKKEISFKVSAMPLEHFLKFKEFADREWGSSYWHTIKFLMDWYENTRRIFEIQEKQDEVENKPNNKKFLGGD